MKKDAVVVLTRGYKNNKDYEKLIHRNRFIAANFYLKLMNSHSVDIIIFHEGNISLPQQKFIQSKSPRIPLIFKSVNFIDNNIKCDNCPPNKKSEMFSMGYKNMCYFWSIRFLNFLKDYDYIIRIDEDCNLFHLDPNIINTYKKNNIYFSSPFFQGEDEEEVVVGMKDLFDNFVKENNITLYNKNIKCPYTNVMILNINYFLGNQDVMNILKIIEKSNCIFSNRWGDLPIWGFILTYLIDSKHYLEDKTIRYHHGSHDKKIN